MRRKQESDDDSADSSDEDSSEDEEDEDVLVSSLVTQRRTPQARFLYTDQIATNSAILRPQDMPPLDYMRGSQKFVDVRLAKWSFEQGIAHVALPREKWWITQIDVDESIYESFTQTFPPHVDDEILSYALKRPNIGKPVEI